MLKKQTSALTHPPSQGETVTFSQGKGQGFGVNFPYHPLPSESRAWGSGYTAHSTLLAPRSDHSPRVFSLPSPPGRTLHTTVWFPVSSFSALPAHLPNEYALRLHLWKTLPYPSLIPLQPPSHFTVSLASTSSPFLETTSNRSCLCGDSSNLHVTKSLVVPSQPLLPSFTA